MFEVFVFSENAIAPICEADPLLDGIRVVRLSYRANAVNALGLLCVLGESATNVSLMSEFDKFHDEFSPCDFILGGTLPFRKEVAALVTCDLVTGIVEGLSDFGYIQKPAAIPERLID